MDKLEKRQITHSAKCIATNGWGYFINDTPERLDYLYSKLKRYTDRRPRVDGHGTLNGKTIARIGLYNNDKTDFTPGTN